RRAEARRDLVLVHEDRSRRVLDRMDDEAKPEQMPGAVDRRGFGTLVRDAPAISGRELTHFPKDDPTHVAMVALELRHIGTGGVFCHRYYLERVTHELGRWHRPPRV